MPTPHYNRVSLFMMKAKQNTPPAPEIPDSATRKLRAKLIFEEALETIHALGFTLHEGLEGDYGPEIFEDDVHFRETLVPDIVQIADGCADISVVTIGTLISCGIDDEPLLKLVDDNNLAKFGPGSRIREDGKVIKPPNHRPPDIEAELLRQSKRNK